MAPPTAPPADAGKKPSRVDPVAPCVTEVCHGQIAALSRLHWPGFREGCRECHVQDDDRHDFSEAETPRLCLDCHPRLEEARKTAKVVHWPAEEDCLGCHDPHGSAVGGLITANSEGDLCFECHDEAQILRGAYSHGPAQQGACSMCHDPHASANNRLLLAQGIELCGQCHEQMAEEVRGARYLHDGPDCTDCHDPHSGPNPRMLQAEKREICRECHGDVVGGAEQAVVDHRATVTGEECLNCHSPHAANSPANLIAPEIEVCLGCHSRPVTSGRTVLLDMGGWLTEHKEWHQPLRESMCTGCHQPHGGDHFRLLRKPFPAKFYSGFDPKSYGLCFSCHEASVVTEERTRTLTRFRDGDRNLHFLHVNKAERGRTCRACHEVHASNRPLHIRDSVPYGKWMMPINFTKLDDGGSCRPGCHGSVTYDRGKK